MSDAFHGPSFGQVPSFSAQTMSSREITELCEKRHDHVMRDIREMLLQLHGEGGLPRFEGSYRGGNGEARTKGERPGRAR